MPMKKHTKLIISILIIGAIIGALVFVFRPGAKQNPENTKSQGTLKPSPIETQGDMILRQMSIKTLRNTDYPGGEFVVEQTLSNGANYRRLVVSYLSEGLKIFGLLTIPLSPKPENGYPAVVFVHGHIPPKQYSTINSYPTYQASLARGGFVTFKPDLRGHGNSEGEPVSAHTSEKYVVDTLYAIEYLKQHPDVDASRLGYWGHSNGGEIGLRVVVINKDIKAASLWAGVVGSYQDMFETYVDDIPFLQQDNPLTRALGLPSQNPDWKLIEPYEYLDDINIPIQLQHGTNDKSVPIELSLSLKEALETEGKQVEYIEYPGDDHNIATNSGTAWQRAIQFYRDNL